MVDLVDHPDLAECRDCGNAGGDMCATCADVLPRDVLPDDGRFALQAPEAPAVVPRALGSAA